MLVVNGSGVGVGVWRWEFFIYLFREIFIIERFCYVLRLGWRGRSLADRADRLKPHPTHFINQFTNTNQPNSNQPTSRPFPSFKSWPTQTNNQPTNKPTLSNFKMWITCISQLSWFISINLVNLYKSKNPKKCTFALKKKNLHTLYVIYLY